MQQVDEHKTDVKGDGPARTTAEDHSRVNFTTEQQSRVQELIDEAYRKAYSKALKSGGGGEEVEKLRTEVEGLREERKTSVILRELSRYNVVDAGEVAELLGGNIKVDADGGVKVVGRTGSVVINNAGQPMGVGEYIGHWLSERPHHLRSSGTGGAGSQGARFNTAASSGYDLSSPEAWRSMPREDLERLLKEGVNVHGSGGHTYRFKDVKNPFVEAKRKKHQRSKTQGAGSEGRV